ncbi:MAG: SDR family oxidoreductase [Planctomycetaceae bacterium]|nr:SDR family oxidoreductase [Planctomycetaceae bacterium]
MDLTRKTVLIAGGRRLGSILAHELAARGSRIAMTWFSRAEPIEETVESCRQVGVDADAYQADLRDPAAVEGLVQTVKRDFGSIDVLLNLISTYSRTPLKDVTAESLRAEVDSNLMAPMYTSVAVGRAMLEQPVCEGIRGKILHFSDWAIDRPYAGFLPYLCAKGGIATLTRALAVELAPSVLVNAIAPGTVLPPPELSEAGQQEIARQSLVGRLGDPRDIVAAAMYLLEGTDFVTGEIVRVDGGRFLGAPSATSDRGD